MAPWNHLSMTSFRKIRLTSNPNGGFILSVSLLLAVAASTSSCGSSRSDSELELCSLRSSISSVGAIDEINTAAENANVAIRIAEMIESVNPASDDQLETALDVVALAYREAAGVLQRGGDLASARAAIFSHEAVAAAADVDDSIAARCEAP